MARPKKNKNERIIKGVLLGTLAIHLIYSNSDLLIGLSELSGSAKLSLLQTISKMFFAMSYSLITVFILLIHPRLWLIAVLACFDGFAIYLKYNIYQTHFVQLTAVYFALYTALIIFSTGLIQLKIKN